MINTQTSKSNWRRYSVTNQKQELARQAMYKSAEVRKETGIASNQPICIYDLCHKLGITVRFVDISMDGMYLGGQKPTFLLSALRPLPRRNFTCAHELGHHVFGHSATIDQLIENTEKSKIFQPEEFLADTFAGLLLMPKLAIRKAFTVRGWEPAFATPHQIFTIACTFGVGYETLIYHMTYALKILNYSNAESLLKVKPKKIREEILGQPTTNSLIIADEHWSLPTIDVEVGNYLLLPHTAKSEKDIIAFEENHSKGNLFLANRPGIVRVYCPDTQWAVFVRVSRSQFIGLSKFRHLEEVEDE